MSDTAATAAIWISASPAAAILVKVTVALGAGPLAARLAARARASVRHAMLAAAMLAAAAIPVILAVIPPADFSIDRRLATVAAPVRSPSLGSAEAEPHVGPGFSPALRSDRDPSSGRAEARPYDRLYLLVALWAIGALIVAAPFALSLWRMWSLRREGFPYPLAQAMASRLACESGLSRGVVVMIDAAVSAPFTFGIAKPTIVLPDVARRWDAAALTRALIHELAHIRRGDWAMHVTARLVCALYWFHPLAWMANRQLALEAERACDDEVVAGNDRTESRRRYRRPIVC